MPVPCSTAFAVLPTASSSHVALLYQFTRAVHRVSSTFPFCLGPFQGNLKGFGFWWPRARVTWDCRTWDVRPQAENP
jgi:hypothetical protein